MMGEEDDYDVDVPSEAPSQPAAPAPWSLPMKAAEPVAPPWSQPIQPQQQQQTAPAMARPLPAMPAMPLTPQQAQALLQQSLIQEQQEKAQQALAAARPARITLPTLAPTDQGHALQFSEVFGMGVEDVAK